MGPVSNLVFYAPQPAWTRIASDAKLCGKHASARSAPAAGPRGLGQEKAAGHHTVAALWKCKGGKQPDSGREKKS